MAKVITTVEGNVPKEKWQALQEGYNDISKSPHGGILQSFITQGRNELTLWRLVTLWESVEKLKAMQESHSVPPGVKIFKDAGIEPSVKIFDVKDEISKLQNHIKV